MIKPFSISIRSDSVQLEGELTIPKDAVGVVLSPMATVAAA